MLDTLAVPEKEITLPDKRRWCEGKETDVIVLRLDFFSNLETFSSAPFSLLIDYDWNKGIKMMEVSDEDFISDALGNRQGEFDSTTLLLPSCSVVLFEVSCPHFEISYLS